MIGMSTAPRKTMPDVYAAFAASMFPARRGAGVTPPSGLRRMLRRLHGSHVAGFAQPGGKNGQPSCTMSLLSFQLPTVAFTFRNSSGVSFPELSEPRPYWTPTLSHGTLARSEERRV